MSGLPEFTQWFMFFMVSTLFADRIIVPVVARSQAKKNTRRAQAVLDNYREQVQAAHVSAQFTLLSESAVQAKMRSFCQDNYPDREVERVYEHLKDVYCALATLASTTTLRKDTFENLLRYGFANVQATLQQEVDEILEHASSHLSEAGIDVETLEKEYRR